MDTTTQDMQEAPTFVPIDVVAADASVSTKTVRRWIKDGCPSHRPSGQYLFDLEEVRAWVRSRCIDSEAGDDT